MIRLMEDFGFKRMRAELQTRPEKEDRLHSPMPVQSLANCEL